MAREKQVIDISNVSLKTLEMVKMMTLKNQSVTINIMAWFPNLWARVRRKVVVDYKGLLIECKLSKEQAKILFPLTHMSVKERKATLYAIVRLKLKGTL